LDPESEARPGLLSSGGLGSAELKVCDPSGLFEVFSCREGIDALLTYLSVKKEDIAENFCVHLLSIRHCALRLDMLVPKASTDTFKTQCVEVGVVFCRKKLTTRSFHAAERTEALTEV
jgi:hypothetical protein